MGEYEPNDSRNVTGTAVSRDGRWTADAASDPNMTDAQRRGQQGGGQTSQSQMNQGQMNQGQMGSQGSQQGFSEPFTQQQAAQAGHQGQQQVDQFGQQQGGAAAQQRAPQQNMGGSQGAVGQANDGVSNTQNQDNDHTSAIGQNQAAGAAGSGPVSYGSQPQQLHDSSGQMGGGQMGGQAGSGRFADQISKHQEVVDSSGRHVGTVDHVDGDRIKLTRQDSSDGRHHYVSISDVQGIENGKICLSGGASPQS